jgi:alpha-beta hydrolase superfamily lysophospholipase
MEPVMTQNKVTRTCKELSFVSHDGKVIFFRHWPAIQSSSGERAENRDTEETKAIVLFHRGHEHSGRMAHLVEELNLPDYDFFAWDARGHGRTAGERGYSPSFTANVLDVDFFIRHINDAFGIRTQDIAVIGQSVGALLVATWVHDFAPQIRSITLASPAFNIKLYVPFARFFLRLLYKFKGLFYVNSYVKAKWLTHDVERIASYEIDPLIARPIAVNVLLDVYDTADRIVADAQAIHTPTQLFISGADWVVHQKPQEQFFDRLSSTVKEKTILDGFYHDTLGEANRAEAIQSIATFIEARFAAPYQPPILTNAHREGYTYQESQALAEPLGLFSVKNIQFGFTKMMMHLLGKRISAGIKLGVDTGFDSGSTLDYVYRNKPTGAGSFGRMVDQNYLDAVGWKGIRVRKQHIETLIEQAVTQLHENGKSIRIMDIAAGHGRYVLDGIKKAPIKAQSILLRDYSDLNVSQGQQLIKDFGLADVAQFIQADAFDKASLASTTPKPTLVIVSGLYELFSDNEQLNQSLAGIAECIEEGGYIIYTGQPWHPQLELIARTLTSHREGQAWVMRRRTQLELDQLVEQVGFEKCAQRIDQFGIFTVSIAQRVVSEK